MNLYAAGNDPHKPNKYILDYFPYPSGSGLSLGHARNYVPTCVSTRFYRMRGYNVLHPMGWDAFGLPAENYAIEHQIHPQQSTRLFANNYRRQIQLLECAYDWSREINSTDPDYYRWTQYFFLLLHKRGLAYQALGNQWWCPDCQTILANEQVENGRCWRCNSEVARKALKQWYFRITDYADRLIEDLDTVDWPEPIKIMQRNWIGQTTGAEVDFAVVDRGESLIQTFTTRPDTLFGVTFLAIAPEHPLVETMTTPAQQTAVSTYVAAARRKTEIERASTRDEKTGVFTGGHVVHPLTGQPIPVWVADYVMGGVGTGAVMGVPAHDERDFAFAQRYGLPIVEVITPDGTPQGTASCFTEAGVLIQSGRFTGLRSDEATTAVIHELQTRGLGRPQTITRLRDWLISRQRYWGAPIPIIHCPACGAVPVPDNQLPVLLPDTADFAPSGDGRSPLARIESWVNVPCPHCGGSAQRETDTMDGFACSSWYFLRFASPQEAERPFDPAEVARWLPVDSYVGGAEHAVMHLLYARFWTKVMFDAGLIDFIEPFAQLRNQGMLLSPQDGRKMSKSKGNVITPDEVIEQVGTDALRMAVLFLGPFDQDVLWDEASARGATRFLDRLWRLAVDSLAEPASQPPATAPDPALTRRQHQLIQRISDDLADFRFNTAVAALMSHLNELSAAWEQGVYPPQWREQMITMVKLLAPICPFITEEIWQTVLGETGSIHQQAWPTFDPALAAEKQVTWMVQVNGKLRDRMTLPADCDEATVRETAVAAPGVQRFVAGMPIRQLIVVPNQLVNIVV